jgi:hypothetical protein
VADICQRYNIPIDRQHIIKHSETPYATFCCGNLRIDWIVARAREIVNGANVAPVQPKQKIGGKENMILFNEGGKVYLWVGNRYVHIGTPAELESIKTMMAKAGHDTHIHTDAKQIKYIKRLATLA